MPSTDIFLFILYWWFTKFVSLLPHQDKLAALLKTAEALKIKGLTEMLGDQSFDASELEIPKNFPFTSRTTYSSAPSLASLNRQGVKKRRRKQSGDGKPPIPNKVLSPSLFPAQFDFSTWRSFRPNFSRRRQKSSTKVQNRRRPLRTRTPSIPTRFNQTPPSKGWKTNPSRTPPPWIVPIEIRKCWTHLLLCSSRWPKIRYLTNHLPLCS